MLSVALHQRSAIAKLKRNRIINKHVVYYENNSFQEEVWLDKDLKPHFLSKQRMNIDCIEILTQARENALSANQNNLDEINKQLENTTNELKSINWLEKLTGVSIKIERTKK
jgi:hypothetical protein